MTLLHALKEEAKNQGTDIVRVIQDNTILAEAYPLKIIEFMEADILIKTVGKPLPDSKVYQGETFQRKTYYILSK